MDPTTQTLTVTLTLSPEVYQRLLKAADDDRQSVSDFLSQLVTMRMTSQEQARQMWEALSQQYRERSRREGTLQRSSAEVLQDLRQTREEIA